MLKRVEWTLQQHSCQRTTALSLEKTNTKAAAAKDKISLVDETFLPTDFGVGLFKRRRCTEVNRGERLPLGRRRASSSGIWIIMMDVTLPVVPSPSQRLDLSCVEETHLRHAWSIMNGQNLARKHQRALLQLWRRCQHAENEFEYAFNY